MQKFSKTRFFFKQGAPKLRVKTQKEGREYGYES